MKLLTNRSSLIQGTFAAVFPLTIAILAALVTAPGTSAQSGARSYMCSFDQGDQQELVLGPNHYAMPSFPNQCGRQQSCSIDASGRYVFRGNTAVTTFDPTTGHIREDLGRRAVTGTCRPIAGQAGAPASGRASAPASTAAAATSAQACSMRVAVYFQFNGAALDLTAQAALENLIAATSACGSATVTLVGHIDGGEHAAGSGDLGARRAEAVRAWLTAAGISTENFEISDAVYSQPAVARPSGERSPANRRVVVSLRPGTP